jgi:bifunctional DNase/RNase
VVSAEPSAAPPSASPSGRLAKGPPEGYVQLEVAGVAAAGPEGFAVVLVDGDREMAVPIFVGGTEALSIELRHNRRRYARPLTHDLLDAIMHELGGELVKIHIDDIREDVFVGAVFVRVGARVFEVDARPSDAIALALGSRVPIYVSPAVVGKAGIKKKDMPTPPAQPTGKPPTAPTTGPQPI